jgi:methylated-DNA-[protein]-cysteine S-methyltransferase
MFGSTPLHDSDRRFGDRTIELILPRAREDPSVILSLSARDVYATPFGPVTLVAGQSGLRAVLWNGQPAPDRGAPGAMRIVTEAAGQLDEYFEGRRQRFDLPLEVHGTPFQRKAWLALASIPFASVISYGEQARRLGCPHSARAIGAANARNPLSIVLPCHRLVATNGALTGYGGGIAAKRGLLDHERQIAEHLG